LDWLGDSAIGGLGQFAPRCHRFDQLTAESCLSSKKKRERAAWRGSLAACCKFATGTPVRKMDLLMSCLVCAPVVGVWRTRALPCRRATLHARRHVIQYLCFSPLTFSEIKRRQSGEKKRFLSSDLVVPDDDELSESVRSSAKPAWMPMLLLAELRARALLVDAGWLASGFVCTLYTPHHHMN